MHTWTVYAWNKDVYICMRIKVMVRNMFDTMFAQQEMIMIKVYGIYICVMWVYSIDEMIWYEDMIICKYVHELYMHMIHICMSALNICMYDRNDNAKGMRTLWVTNMWYICICNIWRSKER